MFLDCIFQVSFIPKDGMKSHLNVDPVCALPESTLQSEPKRMDWRQTGDVISEVHSGSKLKC